MYYDELEDYIVEFRSKSEQMQKHVRTMRDRTPYIEDSALLRRIGRLLDSVVPQLKKTEALVNELIELGE